MQLLLIALLLLASGCYGNLHLPDADPEFEQMKHPTTRIDFNGCPPDKK